MRYSDHQIRNEIRDIVRGYVVLMVSATTAAVVGGLLLYWYLEATFFPQIGPLASHLAALAFVGVIFHLSAHSLFIMYFKKKFCGPDKPTWLREIDQLHERLADVEHQLLIAKSQSKDFTPNQVTEIVLRQRSFLDSTRRLIYSLRTYVQDIKESGQTSIEKIEAIEVELKNLQEMIDSNRNYIFYAA